MRLLETLATLAQHVVTPEDGGAVRRKAQLIVRGSRDGIGNTEDRQRVARMYGVVDQHLSERFGPAGAGDRGGGQGVGRGTAGRHGGSPPPCRRAMGHPSPRASGSEQHAGLSSPLAAQPVDGAAPPRDAGA